MSKKKEKPAPPVPQARTKLEIQQTYKDYFLQYASYVITDRAIPDLADGLKPVQRRILHSLWENEDGRYHKVANIVGHCMKYHPHGDASIFSALVGLGQRGLLLDTQGNWGDPVTGDDPAAARYIEVRLTKFSKEVLFHPDLTAYKLSYDGRNKEPMTLPVRFPLLLATGAEGIAVGLTTRILPHNFLELLDAMKKHLRREPFTLYPDFPTGGFADIANYQDGRAGSRVKVRARMEAAPGKGVIVREIPYGTTTQSLIDSILAASEKGKIKVARIDDNTAAQVEIVVTFQRGVDMDKAMDALYAFTDCEVSLSPTCMVIRDGRPAALCVSEILAENAEQTKLLLKRDLEIQRDLLELRWHHKSLVQIFIENHIYLRIEKCRTWESVLSEIDKGLEPHKSKLRRLVLEEDLIMLTEVKMRRISAWDAQKAKEELIAIDEELKAVNRHLKNVTKYAIDYIDHLIETYGKGQERRTELTSFDAVKAVAVVERTSKLYVERAGGFIGTDLKNGEEIGPCSTIDNVLVILENGGLLVAKAEERKYVGENIVHAQVFEPQDRDIVFNLIYEDVKTGAVYAKRFRVGGVTRDKRYELGGSRTAKILYLSWGEDKFAYIHLRKKPRIKTDLYLRFDGMLVKGRGSGGVTISKHRASSATDVSKAVYCSRLEINPEDLPPPVSSESEEADEDGNGNGNGNGNGEPSKSAPAGESTKKSKIKKPDAPEDPENGQGRLF